MTLTRRGLPLTLVIGWLTASSAAMAQETDKQLYEAAKKEGQVTWYSGILDQPICDKVGQAFAQKYPGIRVNAIKTTSQVAFQRLLQDIKAGSVQADVFTTTDASHMTYLKDKGEIVKFTSENAKDLVGPIKNMDPDGYYQVSWVGLVALLYNTNKVKPEDAPKDWPDLANDKWKNAVSFGSPNYSGMVGVWTVAMEKKFGWTYFEKLNKLNPLIGRSIDDAVTVLNSGERTVAAGNPASALRSAAKGNPLAVNYPTSGTLGVLSPSAVIKGSKSPNAGKLFMDFLAGTEYSKILADNFEQPLRADVPPPKGAKSLADINLFTVPLPEIEKDLPANKDKWRDTFGM